MSDLQINILAKQRQTLQLQVENSMRAKKVADLKFYNRQRLLYPNAEMFYEPTTYSSLIQEENQMENNSSERNKGLLETLLLTITSNKTIVTQVLSVLNDKQVEILVYFFPDFKNELMKNTNSNAITYDVFISFAKKYLAEKFTLFNDIKTEEIPPNPINNPIFQDDYDDGNVEMKFDEDDDDLPTNRNIGVMGRNNQYNALPKKGEKQSRTTMEQTERNNPPPTKRKANKEADNPKPTKKRAIIENITGKRGNELTEETTTTKKTKIDTSFGPFTPGYKLKRILLLFFQKTPARIPEFLPFSNSYVQIKPFIQNLDAETTEKLYERVISKYPRKSLPGDELSGKGINKNRFVFQGKGMADEIAHKKFYVDMKLLNNNILAVKYNSTRNYKMKPTPINDDIKSMVMDILLDKFNQKLFDLLKDNEKTVIIRFVNDMKLNNLIPIKDDKLQEYFKQFLILKGEYLSGNNNPLVKRELRKYTLELMDMKKIPKHTGFALLHELSL